MVVSPTLIPIALALAAAQQSAPTIENGTWDEGMYMFHGSCDRLQTPQADLTPDCVAVLPHWVYPGGRTSYWFAQKGKALVTFSGLNEKRIGTEGGALIIDKVTTSYGPQWQAHGAPARGLCTIANVQEGKVHFECDAETSDGKYSAVFTSDGQPPEPPHKSN